MLPSNSNLSKENCSSTSSNCVVWQGPDISCINLCNGDSISDVTYKLAEEICTLKNNIGVTDVDLTCLVKVCQQTPEPTKTLANILNLLVSKVCCLSDIVKNLPSTGQPFVEPVLNYPACTAFGGLTNDLHRNYTLKLAQSICSLTTTVNNHTSTLTSHNTRITDLEANFPIPKLQLPSCLSNAVETYDVLLQNLETEFCDIKDALGDEGDLNTAKGRICPNLGQEKRLIDSTKTMNSLLGWENVPQNFAQSVNNLWLTVCDIRAAVRSILDNCCKAGCDDILIDFYQRWSTDDDGVLLLNFRSKSKLPLGFYDCGQTSTSPNTGNNVFTFTDATGLSIDLPILFRSIDYPNDKSGVLDDPTLNFGWYELNLSGTGLNLEAGPIKMSSDLCFTDGTIQCIKCVDFMIPAKPLSKCCEITATKDVTIIFKSC